MHVLFDKQPVLTITAGFVLAIVLLINTISKVDDYLSQRSNEQLITEVKRLEAQGCKVQKSYLHPRGRSYYDLTCTDQQIRIYQ